MRQGEIKRNVHAMARLGHNLEIRSQRSCPSAHVGQTLAILPGSVGVESHPVILDFDPEGAILSLRGHEALLRVRMSEAVTQCLPDEVENGFGLFTRHAVGESRVNGEA